MTTKLKNIHYKDNTFSARRKQRLLEKKKNKLRKLALVKGVPVAEDLAELIDNFKSKRFDVTISLGFYITKNFPKHSLAWNILGAALYSVGRFDEALLANQRFVDLSPKDPNAHNNLALTFLDTERLKEAEISFRNTLSLDANHYGAWNSLGSTLVRMRRFSEAEESYKRAIFLKSDYAQAHNNLGEIQAAQGKFNEAADSFAMAFTVNTKYASAYRMYSSVETLSSKNECYSKMEALYYDPDISDEQRSHICFALGKAHEDMQDFEKAFRFLSEGNSLRKRLLNYKIDQDLKLFEEIQSTYSKISAVSFQFANSPQHMKPIFIVGMPRSGTTIVEQIISAHSQVTGAGELDFIARFGDSISRGLQDSSRENILDFRRKYLNQLKDLSDNNSIVTDKMPHNFRYLGLITLAFPESKIVHVRRNSSATCWSNYKNFLPSHALGYCHSLNDIVDYYAMYEKHMKFWKRFFGNKIYDIDYESLTVDQEEETRRLLKFLDLKWEKECLYPEDNIRAVQTTSYLQARNKIYQGSSEKWKNFKPFIGKILDRI